MILCTLYSLRTRATESSSVFYLQIKIGCSFFGFTVKSFRIAYVPECSAERTYFGNVSVMTFVDGLSFQNLAEN